MALVLDSLKSISAYPIPESTIENIALERGLNLKEDAAIEILKTKGYRLSKADVMKWISYAPNVTQGGMSYDILYSDRERLREQANAIYKEFNDPAYLPDKSEATTTTFGYKGDRL